MPDVNILGDISFGVCDIDAVSLTWAIVPGNNGWNVRSGLNFGETHASVTDAGSGKAIFSHPIDVHFQTSTMEGWPLIVMELWDRSFQETKGFSGIGSAWVPAKPGKHVIPVNLWRPVNVGYNRLKELFVPSYPNIYSMRELVMTPHLRSQFETEVVGVVYVEIFCAVSGFDEFGVILSEPVTQSVS